MGYCNKLSNVTSTPWSAYCINKNGKLYKRPFRISAVEKQRIKWLWAMGYNYKQIATQMDCAVSTVGRIINCQM